ncbi:MAG: GspH/FimT family pseudopilin [Alphaproteobacteria bacterium]|nr:GspH/FimT family pseudopilin [Alphaproteobacteria bacterium]
MRKTRPDLRLRRGFTLLEMMIVIAVIAVVAALSVSSLKELIPRFRARQAAHEFASHLEQARQLAIMHNRETKVEIVNYDTDLTNTGTNTGYWEISVGDSRVGSADWDVLPMEVTSGADAHKSEGTFDISSSGEHYRRGVGLAEPDVTEIIFTPKGWVGNSNANFGSDGFLSFVFVNKIAEAQGQTDRYTVMVYRGGMVRVEASLSSGFANDEAGMDDASSLSSTSPN